MTKGEVMTMRRLWWWMAAAVWFLSLGITAHAQARYVNPDTGYEVVLEDDAQLLSQEESSKLAEKMREVTRWGNAAFKTIRTNTTSARAYAESYYRETFGSDSGTVFLIDVDNREIRLRNYGGVSKVITDSYSDTITDNCYRYASRGDYYECAEEAFREVTALLSGQRIAQPMKYVSNFLLAVIMAVLLNYFLMRRMSVHRRPKRRELLSGVTQHYILSNPEAKYVRTTRRYDPQSSDGGSSSGGGGSGGGGSSSGGSGGGHSF